MSFRNRNLRISIFIVSILTILFSISYAFLSIRLQGEKKQVISSGELSLELSEDNNNLTISNALPMYDQVGMIQTPFTFTLTNDTTYNTNYIMRLEDVTSTADKLSPNIVKYDLEKDGARQIGLIFDLTDNIIDEGTIKGNQTIEYTLRLWIDSSVEDEDLINGKSLSYKIVVDVKQDTRYKEYILNGADPVLSNNLVPVVIANNGTVKYANVNEPWYSYKKQQWANAVVLEDNAEEYKAGDVIEPTDIESYFVWIPRYKYKIFNEGNYTGSTSLNPDAPQAIEIVFEDKATPVSNGTMKDGWLSHPAFTSFDTNGFWAGKFESSYRGATSTSFAEVGTADSTKLVIKPNTYSWRNINIGNAFKTCYEYLRESESHMMKNTEWGAVAYLSHSNYGVNTEIYINNNSSYLTGCGGNGVSEDGTTTCFNTYGSKKDGIYNQSTTGNISGVFDMSGGAYEYVMGYNADASSIGGNSEIINLYSDFFTDNSWNKYYDKYSNVSGVDTVYNNRILGDATGEMGPFSNYYSSWYSDFGQFVYSSFPWFIRGGHFGSGDSAEGIFYFSRDSGSAYNYFSFRATLSPN